MSLEPSKPRTDAATTATPQNGNGNGNGFKPYAQAPVINRNETPANWTLQDAEDLYGIKYWGAGYFKINEKGNVTVTPHGEKGPAVDLMELVEDLQDRGIRAPILVRFPDIVKDRIQLLANCFTKAIQEYGYKGAYRGVYPIKVNQQRHLVSEIIEFGQSTQLGIECGSKPELLVGLALMSTPNALVICNGFKDMEYIETALLAQKLGRNTLIVVDRMSELFEIIRAARKLNTRPRIGFRAKLDSKGAGKWVESSGARSKFGLTPSELVEGVEFLKREGLLDCLELLHFHIGSQITSIQAIKTSLTEGVRFYVELVGMGAKMKYMDVGGGLGVDYDGSGSSDSSINYSEQEYANDVVATIQAICDEKNVAHPVIVTEAGRALVAHHSVLVFNVLGVNEIAEMQLIHNPDSKDHKIVKDLFEIYEKLTPENVNEFYNDLMQIKNDALQLFSYGYLSLENRAKAEKLTRAIMTKIEQCARRNEDAADIMAAMENELTDSYFCNFSVFQSVPDSWAVGHIFPLMPIHRLTEAPTKKATIVDLTCDSDGKIDRFSQTGKIKHALELHPFKEDKPYFVGVFLVGAYQEILGDLHNLFGDTDAVHVGISEAGYTIEHVVEGDSVAEVLSYLQYNRAELVNSIRRATELGIQASSITKQEAKILLKHYEDGLAGYTYLEEAEI
ncbi:MAG: biosynthetic arginine decarboxylase [Bdellovibrionales bacterium]|nr:biosynthetic arginine decarboxylase [Bdellovibrionales bacterium]